MSVDFSQFFNGPIRDSLIAQVSGYLDISRQQATTAYDKAVALVIGAMARQAGKPEGAQELVTHIHNSQTQASLTSSALSPTVLTNDQFAQIVTLGQSEQAVILGTQQEAVTSHLEVATGLDTQAVGSLLSIVVPFVLSFLKSNITTESEPAQALPMLLAAQASHVAPQLDAPALAALGEDSLEGLFGAEALAAANANSAAAATNGRQGAAQGTTASDKPANGWFKWVLTLAVVLAGAAWIKSCTQSDTASSDNAKPAEQQQPAEQAPATDTATPTPATPAEPVTPAADTPTENSSQATGSESTAEPSPNFPEPAATPSAGADASATTGNGAQPDGEQAGHAHSEITPPASADQPDTSDKSATPAPAESTETSTPTDSQPASEPSQSAGDKAETSTTDNAQSGAAAGDASASSAETTADGPTYGQASDSMEPDAQEGTASAAAGTGTATEATEQQAAEATPEANTDPVPAETTAAEQTASEQAPATEGAATPTTESDASGAAADNTTTDKAATDTAATDNAAAGKTTAFAEPAPLAEKTDTAADTPTAEPQDTTGKTSTFGESEAFDNTVKPVPPQEGAAGQAADTPNDTATANGAAASSSDATMSTGKTTTFGAAQSGEAAGAATPTEGTTATTNGEGQSATSAAATAGGAQADSVAGRVQLERDGDALRVSGTVPSEAARNRILNAAKLIDGHSKIEDELKVDNQAGALGFDDYSGLLSLLRGYHDVNVSLEQAALTLTGKVTSDAEKEALTTRVQSLVGSGIQINNQASVVAPPQATATAAAETSAALPLVQFASGSAQVDTRFHDSLDKYAQQLKESGKSVRLIGFADESGSEPGNDTLSQRRAESVKAYLILRGVQAQQIQTEGQGTQAPVADNTTQAGRARNRRVEIHEQ